MRSRRRMAKGLAAVAAFALIGAACGDDGGGSASGSGSGGVTPGKGVDCGGKKLALGFFGALSGDAANLGKNIKNGVDLAAELWNKDNPKCQVTIKEFDSQGDPAKAPALADAAVKDADIVGIIGPAFSGESKAANPIFDKAVLPIVTPSATNPALSTNGWKIFHRMLATDAKQGPDVAKYITGKLNGKKVFVIDDQSEYGKGIADEVRKTIGSAKVGDDSIKPGDADYSGAVNKAKAAAPDAIFFGGYYAEAGKLVKQLKDAGVKAAFVSADGVADVGYIKAGGPATKDSYVSCPCNLNGNDKFLSAYKAKFKDDPRTYGSEAYDSTNAFLAAFAAGKTDRTAINDFLKTYTADGASRKIKWDDKGEIGEGPTYIFKSDGSKLVKVDTVA